MRKRTFGSRHSLVSMILQEIRCDGWQLPLTLCECLIRLTGHVCWAGADEKFQLAPDSNTCSASTYKPSIYTNKLFLYAFTVVFSQTSRSGARCAEELQGTHPEHKNKKQKIVQTQSWRYKTIAVTKRQQQTTTSKKCNNTIGYNVSDADNCMCHDMTYIYIYIYICIYDTTHID